MTHVQERLLGSAGIAITPVALGCWPIAGVTTIDVNDTDSIATILACFDLGINISIRLTSMVPTAKARI